MILPIGWPLNIVICLRFRIYLQDTKCPETVTMQIIFVNNWQGTLKEKNKCKQHTPPQTHNTPQKPHGKSVRFNKQWTIEGPNFENIKMAL